MSEWTKATGLDDIDPRLLEEAFRRAVQTAGNANVDPQTVLAAIIAEARVGTRHMFGLVSAASRKRAMH